jgi:hypothetical protein
MVSTADLRGGKRALAPVTELKSGRSTAVADCTELSYEKALQLHGRQRRGAQIDDVSRSPHPSGISSPEAGSTPVRPPQIKEAKVSREDKAPRAAGGYRHKQAAAKVSPGLVQDAKEAADVSGHSRVPASGRNRQASEAKLQDPLLESAAPRKKRSKKSKTKGAASMASVSPAKTSFQPNWISNRISSSMHDPAIDSDLSLSLEAGRGVAKSLFPAAASLTTSLNTSARAPGVTAALDNIVFDARKEGAHRSSLALSKHESKSQSDQRRTILSVRLTDGEFEKLKDRADESGISVSAYMRLCVLDADQLRAQVKQVLAEIRALHQEPESHRPPALAATSHSGGSKDAPWFHVFLKSAAFLLSPLFPFRRSA